MVPELQILGRKYLRFLSRSKNYLKAIQKKLPFNIHIKELKTQFAPYGEDWHPTIHNHKDMKKHLIPTIRRLTGW